MRYLPTAALRCARTIQTDAIDGGYEYYTASYTALALSDIIGSSTRERVSCSWTREPAIDIGTCTMSNNLGLFPST